MLGGGEECCFSSFNLAEDPFCFYLRTFQQQRPCKISERGLSANWLNR